MAQKTRNQLKDLFKPGAKPSGDDFSDFVESTFNIKDDGLEKPVGADAPLKIISYGPEENLLDFYAGDSHSWRLNQKPSAAETPGLNFVNSDGSSKLFIASSSGNIGVSTTNPKARLHILQSGNADALRIDDTESDTTPFLINKNGNVGVGLTSPLDRLDVNGDIRIRGANIKDAGGTVRITLTDNGRLDLKTYGGSTSLSIATNGRVGIGTITPGEKLEVNGYIKTNRAIINDGGFGNDFVGFSYKDNGTQRNYALLQHEDGTTRLNAASGKPINFRINNTSKMTLASNGNVGIGTITPAAKLDVYGDIRIRGADIKDAGGTARITLTDNGRLDLKEDGGSTSLSIATNGKVGIGTTNPGAKLEVMGSGGDTVDLLVNGRIRSNNNNGGFWVSNDRFVGGLSTNKIGIYNNSEWRLTILNDGNVGIGTKSPSEKLEVSGNVKISGKLYVKNNLSVPGGEEDLRMLRGIINTNGSVRKGGGFSSNRFSAGLYDITFNTQFSDNPAASVTQIFEGSNKTGGDTKDNAIIVYIDENHMRVKTGGNNGIANSRTFTFIVIGPR